MDSRHCCVCGRAIEALDVYILRAQGKICSQCVLERDIPVGGVATRRQLRQGAVNPRPLGPRPLAPGFPAL